MWIKSELTTNPCDELRRALRELINRPAIVCCEFSTFSSFYFFFFIVIGHVESVEKPVNPRDFNDSLRGQMWARDVDTL